MNILEPDIKYRYSIEDVLSNYRSAEEAFSAGDYISALKLCGSEQTRNSTEIAGCSYIMAGYTQKGSGVLSAIPNLSCRGQFYLAFAYWMDGEDEKATSIVDELLEGEISNIFYKKFSNILKNRTINILLFGHLNNNGVESLLSSLKDKNCKFNVYTVGYSKSDDIRIRHDMDIVQTIYSQLPKGEHPDFALIVSPYGIFHKNYEDLPIPKIIFMMDHDYFTYNYGGIIKNDIVVVTGSIEHFEVSNFFSLPCHVYYTYDMSASFHSEEVSNQTDQISSKLYDIAITGSTFADFQRQKSQLVYKLIHMPSEWKIRVIDGFMDKSKYFDLLKKTKLTFSSVRFIDLLQQRGIDALKNDCALLYPENSSWPLFFDEQKLPIRPYSLNFETLQSQLRSYLTELTEHKKQEATSSCTAFQSMFKQKSSYHDLRQLKYFSFLSLFNSNDTNEQQRKKSLQETTGANGFEDWTGSYFVDSLDSLKNYLHNISLKTEYHYIKLFNLYIYEGGNKNADNKSIEKRRIAFLYANQVGREGLKRFPFSLVLRFNVARFYFFTGIIDNALNEFLTIVHNISHLSYSELTADIFNFFFPKYVFTTKVDEEVFFPQLDYFSNIIIKRVNSKVSTSLQKAYVEPINIILSTCYYFIAKIYYDKEKLQKSLQHLEYSLDLYPSNYVAQNFIVQVLKKSSTTASSKDVVSEKILNYYLSAVRNFPSFIKKDTFAYAFQAAHNLGSVDIANQLLDSWFLFYKRVSSPYGMLTVSQTTITTILDFMHLYPNSLVHHFLNKTFLNISNDESDSFTLDEGEEQLIYPFFEIFLRYYTNKLDYDNVLILLTKLISTPNLSVERQMIHSYINLLIIRNIEPSKLKRIIELITLQEK